MRHPFFPLSDNVFAGGNQIRERGSKSASRLCPGGPYLLADLDRGGPNQSAVPILLFLAIKGSSSSLQLSTVSLFAAVPVSFSFS